MQTEHLRTLAASQQGAQRTLELQEAALPLTHPAAITRAAHQLKSHSDKLGVLRTRDKTLSQGSLWHRRWRLAVAARSGGATRAVLATGRAH